MRTIDHCDESEVWGSLLSELVRQGFSLRVSKGLGGMNVSIYIPDQRGKTHILWEQFSYDPKYLWISAYRWLLLRIPPQPVESLPGTLDVV